MADDDQLLAMGPQAGMISNTDPANAPILRPQIAQPAPVATASPVVIQQPQPISQDLDNQIQQKMSDLIGKFGQDDKAAKRHAIGRSIGAAIGSFIGAGGAGLDAGGQQVVQDAANSAKDAARESQYKGYQQTNMLKGLMDLHNNGVLKPIAAAAKIQTDAQKAATAEQKRKDALDQASKDLEFKNKVETRRAQGQQDNLAFKKTKEEHNEAWHNTVKSLREQGLKTQADKLENHKKEFDMAYDQRERLAATQTALRSGINDRQMYVDALKQKQQLEQFNQKHATEVKKHNDLMQAMVAKQQNGDPVYKDFKPEYMENTPLAIPDLDIKNFPQLTGNTGAPAQATPAAVLRKMGPGQVPVSQMPPLKGPLPAPPAGVGAQIPQAIPAPLAAPGQKMNAHAAQAMHVPPPPDIPIASPAQPPAGLPAQNAGAQHAAPQSLAPVAHHEGKPTYSPQQQQLALAILKQAGGDKAKARELAKAQGLHL